jgi:hypothetical protein
MRMRRGESEKLRKFGVGGLAGLARNELSTLSESVEEPCAKLTSFVTPIAFADLQSHFQILRRMPLMKET